MMSPGARAKLTLMLPRQRRLARLANECAAGRPDPGSNIVSALYFVRFVNTLLTQWPLQPFLGCSRSAQEQLLRWHELLMKIGRF